MSEIKNLESKIDKILSTRKEELKTISDKLDSSKADLAKAEKALETAVVTDDINAYGKAKEDISRLTLSIELNTKRFDALKKKSYITEDEYNSEIKAIHEELSKRDLEDSEKIKPLLEKIKAIAIANMENKSKANSLLKVWRDDINRKADYQVLANGKLYANKSIDYSNHDIYAFWEYIKSCEYCKNI